MIPNFTIEGWWVDAFLIYWASCYVLFFLVSWVTMKLNPFYYDWTIYISVITRCLFLPIIVPIKFYASWKWKKQMEAHSEENDADKPIKVSPLGEALTAQWARHHAYLEQIEKDFADVGEPRPGRGEERETNL